MPTKESTNRVNNNNFYIVDEDLQVQFGYQLNSEYVYLYLWMLKDYAWASDSYGMAVSFGNITPFWCIIPFYFAYNRKDWEDMYMQTALFLWLIGNWWWMMGDMIKPGSEDERRRLSNDDDDYDDDNDNDNDDNNDDGSNAILGSENNENDTKYIFIVALVWLLIYYLYLKPMKRIKECPVVESYYKRNELDLHSTSFIIRFLPTSYININFNINTIRQYEYILIFFWLLNDLFINLLSPVLWCVSFLFTFIIAVDIVFIYYNHSKNKQSQSESQSQLQLQSQGESDYIDFFHALSQFLWLVSHFAWGCGELFNPKYDDPIPIGKNDKEAVNTGRWWSQVILVMAWMPIAVMYVIYLPYRYIQRRKKSTVYASSSSGSSVEMT